MDVIDEEQKPKKTISKAIMITITVICAVWFTIGLIAFNISLHCMWSARFFGSGNVFLNFLASILALFMGPLYFLLFLSKTYCKDRRGSM